MDWKAATDPYCAGCWEEEYVSLSNWTESVYPVNWPQLINVPPPPIGTTETELEEVRKLAGLQNTYKNEILKEATVSRAMTDAFKGTAQFVDFPVISEAIHDFLIQAAMPMFYFKRLYSRTRPFQVDPKLVTSLKGHSAFPRHPSYPSGHATEATVIAEVLKYLIDPHGWKDTAVERAKIDQCAFMIAYRREIAGFHFRSDTLAGISLGRQIFSILRAQPTLSKKLIDARQRWLLLCALR
jgi:PAP2 superfamily